jgi:pyrroloquinoline-quinone synthase
VTPSVNHVVEKPLFSEAEFVAGFHAIGEERYHHKHPFHLLMHEGRLTRGQLQAWALNRYYYQSRIPIKDAAILARSDDPAFRLAWRKRILDHDGDGAKPGGIEKWLRLVEATGLSREHALRGDGILPATRFAVQGYVDFVSTRSHLEAIASSLTELFSKKLIVLRMDRLREHYPWLSGGLDYFTGRLTQAPEDSEFALAWVVKHARTRTEQDWPSPRCAPSATSSGRSSTLSIFPTSIPDGRPRALSSPQRNREGFGMTPELHSFPRLAPGCRLNEKTQQPRTLLMPERALRLNGPSLEIVERCDGQHTVQQIIVDLQKIYSKAEPHKVEQDILGYLTLLQKERALDFQL